MSRLTWLLIALFAIIVLAPVFRLKVVEGFDMTFHDQTIKGITLKGDFNQTCNNCNWDGKALSCICKDSKGRMRGASMVKSKLGNPIFNCNGQLTNDSCAADK